MRIYLPSDDHTCHCAAANMDPEELRALEKHGRRLLLSLPSSGLRRLLSRDTLRKLKYRTTPLGGNLLHVLRGGMLHPEARQPAVAPDEYAYEVFAPLFASLLAERHAGWGARGPQPAPHWGPWRGIRDVDPAGRLVLSTRVRCARNLRGLRFAPAATPADLRAVERAVVPLLERLPWEYAGEYAPLARPPPQHARCPAQAWASFGPRRGEAHASALSRHWPCGRGVFRSADGAFVVWLNEKDHVRAACVQRGGRLQEAYRRLAAVMPVLDRRLQMARHPRLGFLTVNPANAGTAFHATARVRLPGAPPHAVLRVAHVYHLAVRCLDAPRHLYQVGNRRRLGYTEYELMMEFNLALRQLLLLVDDAATTDEEVEVKAEEEEAEEEAEGVKRGVEGATQAPARARDRTQGGARPSTGDGRQKGGGGAAVWRRQPADGRRVSSAPAARAQQAPSRPAAPALVSLFAAQTRASAGDAGARSRAKA